MAAVRIALAVIAVTAVLALGAVVAFAAPGALGRAVSPQAGAGRLEYCPQGQKQSLLAALKYAQSHAAAAKTAYFAKHHNAGDRAAFLRKQQANLKALQRQYANCA